MMKSVYICILSFCFILVSINGQILSSLPEIPNGITEEIGSCDALLLKLLISGHVSKAESPSLCNIFGNKIKKIDTPLNDLSCSVFGSILVGCDLKLAITSADLLRQYFVKSSRPTLKDLYYLSSILTNMPNDISNVLGRNDIIEDINEIIDDELSRIKKQISKGSNLNYEDVAYMFGTISHLIRLGSKNNNHFKILKSILSWENNSRIQNILTLDSYVMNFSLITRAYFFLKRPIDFNEIPISIHQMVYSLSRINVHNIKNIQTLNEYIMVRKLLIESGIYLAQGHRIYTNDDKIATLFICKLDGSPIDDLSLSLPTNQNITINNIPMTCEYELKVQGDLDKKQEISQILNSKDLKLKVSSKYIIPKEINIPILNISKVSLNIKNIMVYLGSGFEIKEMDKSIISVEHNKEFSKYQLVVEIEMDSNIIELPEMLGFFNFLEIKALEPYKTIGTRTIELFPALVDKNRFKVFVDITNHEFVCTSTEYLVRFIIKNLDESSQLNIKKIFKIFINDSKTDSFNKLCTFKIHPKLAKFHPKEEITYKFKEPRKLPGVFLPYLFSLIIISSMFIVIPIWRSLGKNRSSIVFGKTLFINLFTIIFLITSIITILCYWHSLNIFQFTYIFTPNVVVFFILLRISLNDAHLKREKEKQE